MTSRFQSAALGGLLTGVLSALPFVEIGNACCCLWVVMGGVVATYFRQQGLTDPIETSEAVLVGLIAGVAGAFLMVGLKLAIPGTLEAQQQALGTVLSGNPDLPPWVSDAAARLSSPAGYVITTLGVSLPIYAIFGALGSLLGTAFFRRKTLPSA